jgi:hypothetical protein
MKAVIKGKNLLVYCSSWNELDQFTKTNNIKCDFSGAFEWSGYSGVKTHDKEGKLVFWFKPEHLPELKFN